ncbi:hypothetical protein [Clostridium thermobutyricum]|nr:hypothetical protein [Clostridium thermobutyricum]
MNNLPDIKQSNKIYDDSDEYKNIKEIFDQIYTDNKKSYMKIWNF